MNNQKNLDKIRHSLAHLLAMAVLDLSNEGLTKIKLGTSPSYEDGFGYDFDFSDSETHDTPIKITQEDLSKIEKRMKELIAQNIQFTNTKHEVSSEELNKLKEKLLINSSQQKYKNELIEELQNKNEVISFYESGDFTDLCAGPHISSTSEIDPEAFRLEDISSAYWKSDEKRDSLIRIKGIAFLTKKDLDDFIDTREEARKRDHRKLGKELGLFVFSDLVGPGLPLYTHKGATIRREIQNYSNELRKEIGYQEVHTPQMNKAELFKISGHYDKYKEDMFRVVSNYTKEEYYLKPMNCPQHTQIFASEMRSYKDMPIRIADFANLYRDEKPGELSGLTRLRAFSQDDGHCFCREDQVKEEFGYILNAIEKAMKTYGMNYYIRLSLRDENKKENYLGDDETWMKTQKMLEDLLIEKEIKYISVQGEAAFYGPKMDLIAKDSLNREWQLSTIQIDPNMPKRFGLEYIGEDGQKHTPIMIHSALVGSPERFLGVLIEHYTGAFPTWLSPTQAVIIPVSDKFSEYAEKVKKELTKNGIRAKVSDESETLGKRIRLAQTQKIPYSLVIGEKEVESNTVAVRSYKDGDQGVVNSEEFVKRIVQEIEDRK